MNIQAITRSDIEELIVKVEVAIEMIADLWEYKLSPLNAIAVTSIMETSFKNLRVYMKKTPFENFFCFQRA